MAEKVNGSRWGRQYARKSDAFSSTEQWWEEMYYLIEISQVQYKDAILDFGCNTGRLLRMLELRGFKTLYGVDINPEGIKLAEVNTETIDFKEQLSGERYIDTVFCTHVLPQLEEPEKELLRMWDCLKPGGQLVMVLHNKWNDWLWKPVNWVTGYRDDPTITKNYSIRDIRWLLKNCGFLLEQLDFYGEGFYFMKPRLVYLGRKP